MFLIILDWQNIANSFNFCSSKVGFNDAGYEDHLSSSILWRILEAFRSIIPMLKILARQKTKTNFVKTILSTHYSPSKLRRAYKCTSMLACFRCHASTLPLWSFVCFPIFFWVGGVQQLLLLWPFFTSCQDRMCVYLSWGVLVAPQLFVWTWSKDSKEFRIHSSQPNCLAGCYCF